ncbi:MAG: hypothetical protein Q4E83_01575 [bacterium]|nr:hypothetical protein [bacterium]
MDLDGINNFKNLPEIAEILESCKNNDYNNQPSNSIFGHIINSKIYDPDWKKSKNTTENLIQKIKQLFINQIKNELSNKKDNKPETTLEDTKENENITIDEDTKERIRSNIKKVVAERISKRGALNLSDEDIEYWTDLIYKNSKEFNFPPEVLIAIIRQECDFKTSIKNPMQITRITVDDNFLHKNKYCKLNEKLYNKIMSLCNGNKNKLINLYKTNPDVSIKIGMLCYLSKGNSSKNIDEWNLEDFKNAAKKYNGSPHREQYANSVEGLLKILDFPNTSIDVYYAQNTENPQNTQTEQFGV